MLDVLIVGAGPAGATTAIALLAARPELAGRVVLLERATFPREKPCAGALGARGDAILSSLGVEIQVPGAAVDGIAFRGKEAQAVASPGRIGRVVRRIEFDHALVRAAVDRGAELREGVRVESVRDEGDAGAVAETSLGALRARLIVGCDGVGSVVRRALGLGAGKLRAQVVEVDTEPVAGDLDRSLLFFDASDRTLCGYAWDFPTVVDGRALMCRGVYALKLDDDDWSGDVAARLDARLRSQGIDPATCRHKRFAERGYEPAPVVARGALMLAGEAAGIDPVTGEGIAQALEYGWLAGRHLASIWPGRELGGWNQAMARSRLARDLRIRSRFVRTFYGPHRPALEGFFTESSDALHVGCQHFAAQPYDYERLLDVLGRGAARLLAAKIRTILAR